MQIISLGGPAIKIISKSSAVAEGEIIIIINPYSAIKGVVKLRKQNAHLVLASQVGKNYYDKSLHPADAFVIDSPGEYEVKNILINAQAVQSGKERSIVFRLDIESVSVGVITGLAKLVEDGLMEFLEGVDILIVPVGGNDVLDSDAAIAVINQLEPRIIIPVQYKSKKFPAVGYEALTSFLKEFGQTDPGTVSKFRVQRKDLPTGERKLVMLE